MRRARRVVAMPIAVLFAVTGFGSAATGATQTAPPSGLAAGTGGPAASRSDSQAGKQDLPVTVTLVTGDEVQVTTRAGSAPSVAFIPAPGSKLTGAVTRRSGDHVYVIPEKAVPLLAKKRLDVRLFDVTTLADQVRRRGTSDLRLLVTAPSSPLRPGTTAPAATAKKTPPKPPAAPKFSKRTRALDSVGASAVRLPAENAVSFWSDQTGQTLASDKPAKSLGSGIGSIWLDAPVKATLDRSVRQIHADQLWNRTSPLTGKGVKVAVLDTGIDDQHVDVKGQVVESASFVPGDASTDDPFGHGTHVASIVAGTGAMSAGRLPAPFIGVAPEASLLDGRVLDEFGSGDESWIIAGMEWAADQGADIVSMSLGGDPTDGTDPMAAAVDRLTADKDVLFVIAAGNSGPDAGTVGSPGSAASALTVGAVDRDDTLADFSSRGPVLGGSGIKPEITAPGVEIVAAAAAGSLIDQEVGEIEPGYLAISGTSMATPHVAGVAALLAQEYPGESATELKARLVDGAVPYQTGSVWVQGGGRVDAVRSLTDVTTEQSTLNLGFLPWPHAAEEPRSRELTYRNHGDAAVTLDLAATAQDDDGAAAADAGFTLSAPSVTIPAGGTASVTLTGTPEALTVGNWSGRVTATLPGADEPLVGTPFGLIKETEHYDVHVNLVDLEGGSPEFGVAEVTNLETGVPQYNFCEPCDKGLTFRVEPGGWFADGVSFEDTALVTLVSPKFQVTEATSVTLDSRRSVPVSFSVPDKKVEDLLTSFSWDYLVGDYGGVSSSTLVSGGIELRATPVTFEGLRSGADSTKRRPTVVATTSRTAGQTFAAGVWWSLDQRWEGTHTAGLVLNDLSGSAEQVRRAVHGKFVVARFSPESPADDLIAKAAAAGAKAIILLQSPDVPEDTDVVYWPTRKPALPALGFSEDDGAKIEQSAQAGAAMTVKGRQSTEPVYQLAVHGEGGIPSNLTHSYTAAQLHVRTEHYRALGERDQATTIRFSDSPIGGWAVGVDGVTPFSRTDYLSEGGWWEEVDLGQWQTDDGDWADQPGAWFGEDFQVKAGGKSQDTWLTGPLLAADFRSPDGYGGLARRFGDTLQFYAQPWNDGNHGHVASVWGMTGHWKLTSRGDVLGEGEGLYADVEVPAGRRSLTLAVSGALEDNFPAVQRSRSVSAVWTFPSSHVDEEEENGEIQSLIALDVDLALDRYNRAEARSTSRVGVTGFAAGKPVRLSSLTYEISSDGGKTWRAASVSRAGDGFTATVREPGKKGLVDLRITAKAPGGRSVTQTITQAYGIR